MTYGERVAKRIEWQVEGLFVWNCPVQLPQLQTCGGTGVQLAPQPPPDSHRPIQRPIWMQAPLRAYPLCCQEKGEDTRTGNAPSGKSQPLHPKTPRHQQELPRMAVQEVGLSRSPQNRDQAEAIIKKRAGQRGLAPCPHQQGLARPKDWLRPVLQPLAFHIHPEPPKHQQELPRLPVLGVGLSRSPQSRDKVEAAGKRPVSQRDSAPCPCQQDLGPQKNWSHSGLQPFARQLILAAPPLTPFWWPVHPCAGAAHMLYVMLPHQGTTPHKPGFKRPRQPHD
ncbi:hypothetical protein Y1Q_0020351 [Alligator mississippiensis]|uniref:Uncharacterized protein n=1 Tax=Alligator mississippiensis TaxID=8496 RepID=A0A151N6G2_ALLMI|nr:hypothetical protein Y1Q_0020351 [Alligator mississippiensis]